MAKDSDETKNQGRAGHGGKQKGVAPTEESAESGGENSREEEMDDLLDILGDGDVEVLEDEPAQAEEAQTPALRIQEEETDTFSEGAVTAPGIGKSSDPVRMYLREMGGVSLLTREGEVVIAKRIEEGQKDLKRELLRSPVFLSYAIELGEGLKEGTVQIRDLFAEEDAQPEEEEDLDELEESEAPEGEPEEGAEEAEKAPPPPAQEEEEAKKKFLQKVKWRYRHKWNCHNES